MTDRTNVRDKNGSSDYSKCEYFEYHEGAKYCTGCGWNVKI